MNTATDPAPNAPLTVTDCARTCGEDWAAQTREGPRQGGAATARGVRRRDGDGRPQERDPAQARAQGCAAMMSATLPALVTGLALFGVDKLTKMWAWNTLQDGPEASVPLGLEFFLHTGDHPTWRIILGIAFLAAGVEAVRRKHLSPLAWSLWAAAAAGNLSDLMHRGGVVDFIAVQVGPVKGIFNIADFALYGVAASILVSGLRPRRINWRGQR